MNKINIIVNTFIEPILVRVDTAISELEKNQIEEEKRKKVTENIDSIAYIYLKNCNREIENNFPFFHDLQLNLPKDITPEGMMKDFVKFRDSVSECLNNINLDGEQDSVLKSLLELKKKAENYRETVKSIIDLDKSNPTEKASHILEEIENMEKELKDIVDNKTDYSIEETKPEEMSAYDRFMQVINDQPEDDISVDDIINDIKSTTGVDTVSNEHSSENDDNMDSEMSSEDYLYKTIQDFNNYINEINKDNDLYNSEIKDDTLEIKSFNENEVEEKDNISAIVYNYISIVNNIKRREKQLTGKKSFKNKFIKKVIRQMNVNKEILEVKLSMLGVEPNQVINNPQEAIKIARKRKLIDDIQLTSVGDFEKIYNGTILIKDTRLKEVVPENQRRL